MLKFMCVVEIRSAMQLHWAFMRVHARGHKMSRLAVPSNSARALLGCAHRDLWVQVGPGLCDCPRAL